MTGLRRVLNQINVFHAVQVCILRLWSYVNQRIYCFKFDYVNRFLLIRPHAVQYINTVYTVYIELTIIYL